MSRFTDAVASILPFRGGPITRSEYMGLGLREEPFARAKGAPATSGVAYVRVRNDRPPTYKPSNISLATINMALDRARLGNMKELGHVLDVFKNTDPTLKSARKQRKNKVARLRTYLRACDDSDKARVAADFVQGIVRRSGQRLLRKFTESVMEAMFDGGGWVQATWALPNRKLGRSRTFTDFEHVPLCRTRYGVDGRLRFAVDPFDTIDQALLFEELPPGAMIPVYTDEDMLDYGSRGVYRTLLSDLMGRVKVWSDYLAAIEQYANPIPVGKSKTETGRKILTEAFKNLGSNGSLVGDETADIELIYSEIMKAGNSPYREFFEVTDKRILLGVLHATQTAQVQKDEGSKATAGTHENVQLDGAAADWELVGDLGRRFLFGPILEDGMGEGWSEWAPEWVADLSDPAQSLLQAQAAKAWVDLGLPIGYSWAYDKSGAAQPLADEKLLSAPAPPAPFGGKPAKGEDEEEPPEKEEKAARAGDKGLARASVVPALPRAEEAPEKDLPSVQALERAVRFMQLRRSGEVPVPTEDMLRAEVQAFADNLTAGVIESLMHSILATRSGAAIPAAMAELDGLIEAHTMAGSSLMETGPFTWLDDLVNAGDVDSAMRAVIRYQAALAGLTRAASAAASARFRAATSLEAVLRYWREREVLPYATFKALEEAEKALAWSTSLNFEMDLLQAIHDELGKVILNGGDLRDFLDRLQEVLPAFGRRVVEIPMYRLNLIFFQEFTRGFLSGRYAEMFSPAQMAVVDGWQYFANAETIALLPDHNCSLMDGLVFRKDDVEANGLLPQLHFKCRCLAIGVKITAETVVSRGADVIASGISADAGFAGDKLSALAPVFGKLGG